MAGPLFTLVCVLGALLTPWPVLAEEIRQKIVIGGAPSLIPAAEKFSAQFRKEHPDIEIEIRGGGSNYAVDAVRLGKLDVGLVTRNLTAREQEDLHFKILGHDAIMVLTYGENPIRSLTLQQIRGIYLGKITSWIGVGGEDRGIIPLTREPSSALRTIFLQRIFGRVFDGKEKAFTIRASKEKILRTIKRVEGSLGYGIVSLEEAKGQGVTVLAVDGSAPTAANIEAGSYPLTRPQLLISRAGPNGALREWMVRFAKFVSRPDARGDR